MRTLEQKVAALQEDLGRSHPEIDFSSASPADAACRESGTPGSALRRHTPSSRGKRNRQNRSRPSHSLLEQPGASPSALFPVPPSPRSCWKASFSDMSRGHLPAPFVIIPAALQPVRAGHSFLDEIGDLPLSLQPKLLRFVQDREYERVGDYTTRKADVRIITATNVNLEKAVKEGRFREDLFYRLNVIQIEIPPLRERPDDVVALAERLLAFYGRNNHRSFIGFTQEALQALKTISLAGQCQGIEQCHRTGRHPLPDRSCRHRVSPSKLHSR